MKRPLCRISPIWLATIAAAIPAIISNCLADTGSIPGATTQSTSEVIASLRQLSHQPNLELSTHPTSATDNFCFDCFAKVLDLTPEQFELAVVKNGKRVSMVVGSTDGYNFYSYLTNGLLLAVDHDNPAELVRLRGSEANPAFTFAPANGFPVWFRVGITNDKPEVSFCPGALIDQIIPAITSAFFDPKTRVYSIQTQHSTLHIGLSPAEEKAPHMPICAFADKSPSQGFGVALMVSDANLPSSEDLGMLQGPDRIDDAVDQVGVKVVNVEASDPPHDILRLVPPKGFPNGRYADTSVRLRLIILGESCASKDKGNSKRISSSQTSGREKYEALRKQFAEAGHLRLSSGSDTSAEKFLVECGLRSGPDCVEGYDVAVIRNGSQNAVVVSDVWGRPYSYMTDGFVTAVDLSNPGGLVELRGMSPSLTVSGLARRGDDLIKLKLTSRPHAVSEMDVTKLIAPDLTGVRRICYQPDADSYLFVGSNGMGEVAFRMKDSESLLPIRAFRLSRINNSDLWLEGQILNPGTVDYVPISPQAVAKAGLPVRDLSASDAASLPLFPPADFGLHSGYIVASKALRSLIPKDLIANQDLEQQDGTN